MGCVSHNGVLMLAAKSTHSCKCFTCTCSMAASSTVSLFKRARRIAFSPESVNRRVGTNAQEMLQSTSALPKKRKRMTELLSSDQVGCMHPRVATSRITYMSLLCELLLSDCHALEHNDCLV